MALSELVVLTYAILYLTALAVAVRQRKSFPLAESLMVIMIVGIGFTGLVFLVSLPLRGEPAVGGLAPGELAFTIIYLILASVLLVFRLVPESWKGHFWKEKLAAIAFKLPVFVIIPILALRIGWKIPWGSLGFTLGDAPGQLLAALVLIVFFGGFNYLAGSGAAPIRRHEFSARQVALGFGFAYLWNMLETGLVEEFFFRAFLQTRLINVLGSPLAGICAAALLFGLAHAPGIYLRHGDRLGPLGEHPSLLNSLLYAILVLSPTGWFTGLLYLRTQSLLAPILVHAAIDAVAHTAEFIAGLKIPK